MRNFKYGLLLFGSLWGVAEVFAGEALFSDTVPYTEVCLRKYDLRL